MPSGPRCEEQLVPITKVPSMCLRALRDKTFPCLLYPEHSSFQLSLWQCGAAKVTVPMEFPNFLLDRWNSRSLMSKQYSSCKKPACQSGPAVFPGVTLCLSQMLCSSLLSTFNEVRAALKSGSYSKIFRCPALSFRATLALCSPLPLSLCL